MLQLASDNFTRANSTGLGANWTVIPGAGTFDIVSNKAACHDVTADSSEFYNAVAWPSDQYSEITVGAPGSPGIDNAGIGCLARASASANSFYRAFATGPSGNLYLRKRVAGAGTSLQVVAASVAPGDTLRLVCIGTTISVWLNGVIKISIVDASIASGSPGIHYSSTDSNVDSISLWTGGDANPLSAAAQSVATVTDALSTFIPVIATAQDAALATGSLTTVVRLNAGASTLSNAVSALVTAIQLAGQAHASSSSALGTALTDESGNPLTDENGNPLTTGGPGSPSLTTGIPLAAAAADVVSTSAALLASVQAASAASVTVSASAALSTGIPTAGTAADTANAVAGLTVKVLVASAAQSVASAAAAMTTAIRLFSTAVDTVTAVGTLAVQITLSDTAQAVSTAHANITTAIQLLVSALSQAMAGGDLTTRIRFGAQAKGLARAVAALSTNIEVQGSAQAAAQGTGELSPVAAYEVGGSDLGGYLRPLPSYPLQLNTERWT